MGPKRPAAAGIASVDCWPLVSRNLWRHRGSEKFANQTLRTPVPTHLGRVYLDRCCIQHNLRVLQVFDIGGDHVLEEEEEADAHVARDVLQQALDAHELQEERRISFFEPGLVRCEAGEFLARRASGEQEEVKGRTAQQLPQDARLDCPHVNQVRRGLMTICGDGDTVGIDFGSCRDNVTRHVAPCFECSAQAVAKA